MDTTRPFISDRLTAENGMSIIETVIACALLVVAAAGLLGMAALATNITENQGHLNARTTEYAQDKMEQLLALKYGDAQTDTTISPVGFAGGTGLAIGGSVDPAAPAALYVDYLDGNGNLLVVAGNVAPAGWFYKRQWQITAPAGTVNLKQITVMTIVASSLANMQLPQSTVTALKTFPF